MWRAVCVVCRCGGWLAVMCAERLRSSWHLRQRRLKNRERKALDTPTQLAAQRSGLHIPRGHQWAVPAARRRLPAAPAPFCHEPTQRTRPPWWQGPKERRCQHAGTWLSCLFFVTVSEKTCDSSVAELPPLPSTGGSYNVPLPANPSSTHP